jgi:flagellar L-ring protein precursor FlgH
MKTMSKCVSKPLAALAAPDSGCALRDGFVGTICGLVAVGLVATTCFAAISARADSLWPATGAQRSMYADKKAGATGDILTIIVAESAVATNSQTKKTDRDATVEDAMTKFVYSGLGKHKGELPGLSLSGSASYSGGGQVNNSQSLTARAAVLVSDVLPNGNLVIEGVRVVTFSGETQYVVLHGIVRPFDITSDNTILSTNVADARVEFYSEGQLTDAQKRGWLTKIYEKLRPL